MDSKCLDPDLYHYKYTFGWIKTTFLVIIDPNNIDRLTVDKHNIAKLVECLNKTIIPCDVDNQTAY